MTQPELICFLPGVCGKWVDYLVYGLMLVVCAVGPALCWW